MKLRHLPASLLEIRSLPDRIPAPQSYLIAMLLVGIGFLVRWQLAEALESTHFLAFYPVLVFAAILGGFGPGLLAVALSWLCVTYFFDGTPRIISLRDPAEFGRFIVFAAGGLGVSIVSEAQLRGKERRIQQARELQRLTQLTNLGPFIVRDSSDRIIHWSDGCARLYGYSAGDALGKISNELLQTEFPKPLDEINSELRKTGRWEGEVRHRRADGTLLTVSSQWVLQDNGSEQAILEVCTDITRLKETEQSLIKTSRELKRSNEDLEDFAYIASHDLQEPLRGISGFLTLLQRRYSGKLDAKAEEYINYAVDGAARMSRLINDLLEYSRVGRKDRPLEPTDMQRVLTGALANLQTAIGEADAQVSDSGLPTLMGDPVQLAQLLQNLIGNAIKFRTPERPCAVHVGAEKEGPNWKFWVKDNGIGIEAEYYQRIFEIFRRLHSSQKYAGTGIGLALCKKIVERHGGRIWVESKPGEGSTFYFLLPARTGSEGNQIRGTYLTDAA